MAALVALPLHLSASSAPASPTVPLAPPPATTAPPTSPPPSPAPTVVSESATPDPGRATRGVIGPPSSVPTSPADPSSSPVADSRIAPSVRQSPVTRTPTDATRSALRRNFG
ncbi:hypothetical protein ACQEV4_02500 [Streptomyces shenzhenensis]|uniref:hypothetical protein n=1 Tax=Streptomyces shenzhenensis TaxID=943815 RepID=UPI003D8CB003